MKRRNIIVIFSFVFVIVLLHFFGYTRWIDSKIQKFINSGLSEVYKISINNSGLNINFKSVDELKAEYIDLLTKYNSNIVESVDYELIKEENKNLREQLNFLSSKNYNSVGADVISRSTDALRNTIIINRGFEDGLDVGMSVMAGNGFYIGKIQRVDPNTSIVQLVNDQYSKVAATVVNKSRSIGIVEGGYGLSLQMNFIPQNEDIAVGENVITSGLEEEIPYGFILGRIDIVEKEPYQPFQKAIVTPFVDLNKIQYVSIIINQK